MDEQTEKWRDEAGPDTLFFPPLCLRMPELGPSIHKALMNSPSSSGGHALAISPGLAPKSVMAAQRYRQSVMIVPKFRNAAITPSVSAHVIRDVDDASVHVYKR